MERKEKTMATIVKRGRATGKANGLPPLENGDRLDQKTFHARYKAMPEHVRAELIGGIVYMASPQKVPHGQKYASTALWITTFESETPGTQTYLNSTQILGPDSEPQPDGALFIEPEYGGQMQVSEDDYWTGSPELIAEISSSSEAIDLHAKKADYEAAGVQEYIVVALRRKEVFWFVRHRGKFKPMMPDSDGILRSKVFPGLWLDPAALLRRDLRRLLAVLRKGLGTPEHAAFVAKLASQQQGK
jgi:Uma2 family endonuclease